MRVVAADKASPEKQVVPLAVWCPMTAIDVVEQMFDLVYVVLCRLGRAALIVVVMDGVGLARPGQISAVAIAVAATAIGPGHV